LTPALIAGLAKAKGAPTKTRGLGLFTAAQSITSRKNPSLMTKGMAICRYWTHTVKIDDSLNNKKSVNLSKYFYISSFLVVSGSATHYLLRDLKE